MTGTITTIAGFPVEVTLARRGAASASDTGQVARRQFRSSASRNSSKYETRTWRLTFGPEAFSTLLASFDAGLGGALPLTWTPPPPDNGAAIEVRFVDNSLRVSRGPGPAIYAAQCELEEVI